MVTSAASFCLTIDTEADDEWSGRPERSYRNVFALPRLQELCDKFGARPTYLVTHDVCADHHSARIIADLAQTDRCEIGSHLHAWTTPPRIPTFEEDTLARPYLSEYDPGAQREKLSNLTDIVTEVTGRQPVSYRGGRWDVDMTCLDLLAEAGYQVDTSVTPLVSWARASGVTKGGPVHSTAPREPYRLSRRNMYATGDHTILEVPVTVGLTGWLSPGAYGRLSAEIEGRRIPWGVIKRLLRWTGAAHRIWLDPVTESVGDMLRLCRALIAAGASTLNVAIHSSELVAGCAPDVPDEDTEARVWRRLRDLLRFAAEYPSIEFMTLSEVADGYGTSSVAIAEAMRG